MRQPYEHYYITKYKNEEYEYVVSFHDWTLEEPYARIACKNDEELLDAIKKYVC